MRRTKDEYMRKVSQDVYKNVPPWDQVDIKEAENSITLYIKPEDSAKDYKVIIMEHKPRKKVKKEDRKELN